MRKHQTLFISILSLFLFMHTSLRALNNKVPEITQMILPVMHNEVVGIFVFEKYSDDLLLLTATVEKKHFIYALKKEGSCSKKDMMNVCGNKYLTDNFQVVINGKNVNLEKENLTVGKEDITLTYTIGLPEAEISEIKITGDYMFKYNDHSILKVLFDLKGSPRNFNIKKKRRTIIAKF